MFCLLRVSFEMCTRISPCALAFSILSKPQSRLLIVFWSKGQISQPFLVCSLPSNQIWACRCLFFDLLFPLNFSLKFKIDRAMFSCISPFFWINISISVSTWMLFSIWYVFGLLVVPLKTTRRTTMSVLPLSLCSGSKSWILFLLQYDSNTGLRLRAHSSSQNCVRLT